MAVTDKVTMLGYKDENRFVANPASQSGLPIMCTSQPHCSG
jgi:hypothetical protein